MIITITGKPCSGKGTVSQIFCEKYNFELICTGDMFRDLALKHGFKDILSFQKDKSIVEADHEIDAQIEKLGKTRQNDNIVIDSRLAWHFVPNSFKVFIDVSDEIAAKRLFETKRESEKVSSVAEAKKLLIDRWKVENKRFTKIYNTNNLNLNNYDFVISSNDLTPEQIVEKIYKEYKNYLKKTK